MSGKCNFQGFYNMILFRLIPSVLWWLWGVSLLAHAQANETVRVEGFARLFEEQIPLSNALVSVEEYDWNKSLEEEPLKVSQHMIMTNQKGLFSTRVTRDRWFRLSLQAGAPRDYKEARNAWTQHVAVLNTLMEISFVDELAEFLLAHKISDWTHSKLLNYIAMDSGLMLADHDYWTTHSEISFQVPLRVTYELLKFLQDSVYGVELNPGRCQLVVTALAPRSPPYLINDPAPRPQTLYECPHGARNVTFLSQPASELIHYLGIKGSCKTDLLATGLKSTSRDGGALLSNITPSKGVSYLDSWQDAETYLGRKYFLCKPGSIINISPPQGPVGRKDETDWEAEEGSGPDWRVVYGIVHFAHFLFPEVDEIATDITDSARTASITAWLALWLYTAMPVFDRVWKGKP